MLKKTVRIVLVVFLVSSVISTPLYADDPLKKLGRGVSNVLLCPMEVLRGIGDANKESGWFAGATWGFLQGVFKGGMRGVVGAYEVVTFPIPFPKDYKPILTDPEFMFEDAY